MSDLIHKQEEYTIYLDKLTWSNFLKTINDLTKIFVAITKNESFTKKNKKSAKMIALYQEIKEKYNICNTIIILVFFLLQKTKTYEKINFLFIIKQLLILHNQTFYLAFMAKYFIVLSKILFYE